MRRFTSPSRASAPRLLDGFHAAGLRRYVTRHRRLLAALACCAAAATAVQALIPPDASAVATVRAARELPAGAVLDRGSLQIARVPAEAVPPGSYTAPDELLGRRLATPLLEGSPVTDVSLAGPGLLAGAPPGTVAIPLRPADPSVLDLLSPGQLVNVVSGGEVVDAVPGTEGAGAKILAASVPVLWVSGTGSSGAWPGTGGSSGTGLVVVAADRGNAARLTAASGAGGIYLVLTGG